MTKLAESDNPAERNEIRKAFGQVPADMGSQQEMMYCAINGAILVQDFFRTTGTVASEAQMEARNKAHPGAQSTHELPSGNET